MAGTLFVVATPIGNLQDISKRAIETLQKVDIIACEDTRKTGFLLKHINSLTPMPKDRRPVLLSYYEQNEFQRMPQIISQLKNDFNVALVSDAGTPTISDPGFKLVRACIQEGIKVESIPGPSSVLTALVVSGLPTDKFLFLGYLPRKEGHRKKLLHDITLMIRIIRVTVILFEAPHRLMQTLQELQENFGNISIVICRELTKLHEEIRRESIQDALSHFQRVAPKGEFVILFHLNEQE